MKHKFILWVLLFMTLSCWAGAFSVKTTDLSYILPHNGQIMRESGCTDSTCWVLAYDGEFNTSTAYFYDNGPNDRYAVLQCSSTDRGFVYGDVRIHVGPNLCYPMLLDTTKRLEFLVKVTFRGAPYVIESTYYDSNSILQVATSYSGGKILGCLQPQVNNGFISRDICSRYPGESPAFMDAVTIKGVDDRNYDIKMFHDGHTKRYRAYTVSTYAITTNWVTFDWRFNPIQEDCYKLGYIGVIFVANNDDENYLRKGYTNVSDNQPTESVPLPCHTAIHVKEIKLYALSYED